MNERIVLSGSLSFLSVGDIIQLVGSSASTGVLRLINRFAAIFMLAGVGKSASPALRSIKLIPHAFISLAFAWMIIVGEVLILFILFDMLKFVVQYLC